MQRDASALNWAMLPMTFVALVLLGLALMQLGRGVEGPGSSSVQGSPRTEYPAAAQTKQYFDWPNQVQWQAMTKDGNPFFTLAIQAPPPPKPPPAPPATKKVDVIYRGFFETSAGVKRAVVQVADKQVITGIGGKVLADFLAAEIALRHLQLTNAAGKAVKLEFTKPQSLEIPAQ